MSLTFKKRTTFLGTSYNYFRDYDPSTGRYIQSDPIGLVGGVNTNGYVGGDPVNWIDPMGLATFNGGSMSDLSPGMQAAVPTVDSTVSDAFPNHTEATIVSTTGGAHNPGIVHGAGNAFDIRVWSNPNQIPNNFQNVDPSGWVTPQQAAQCAKNLSNNLGPNYTVINELIRPPNQQVWSRPHIHIQYNGE